MRYPCTHYPSGGLSCFGVRGSGVSLSVHDFKSFGVRKNALTGEWAGVGLEIRVGDRGVWESIDARVTIQ